MNAEPHRPLNLWGLKGARVSVLLYLSAHAGPDGRIQQSAATIAAETHLSEFTVRVVLDALCEDQHILRIVPGKGGAAAIYKVLRGIEFTGKKQPERNKTADETKKDRPRTHYSAVKDALGTSVSSLTEFLDWCRNADAGKVCIYHYGQIGLDRSRNPDLDNLARTVAVLQEAGYISIGHHIVPLVAGRQTAYTAIRSAGGQAPKSILDGSVTATEYQALRAISDRSADISAARALRYDLSLSERAAAGLLDNLKRRRLVVPAKVGKGVELSDEGRRMVV